MWLLSAVAVIAVAACDGEVEGDDDSADDPHRTVRDVVFAGTADGVELAGDLFLPAGVEAAPVVLLVHGGGFFEGYREELEPVAVELQAHGLASYTIDYRLVGLNGGEFPGSSVDVRDAVRFLRAHADEYGLGNVCGAWGSSAGGTLAALAALTDDDPLMARAGWRDLYGHSDSAPVFGGAYAIYDFTTREQEHGDVPGPELNWLGGEPAVLAQRYEYASPISHVDGGDGPVVMVQGEEDGLVPLSQATSMLAALQEVGVDAELHTYAGAMHSFLFPLDETNPDGMDALTRSADFLAARCGEGAATPTGEQTVVQQGEATWDGAAWSGSETYALQDAAGATLCQRTYATTGAAVGDVEAAAVTYALLDEQGDCASAPYAPDPDATWTYILGVDTRDGSDALFRDADGLGDFRWFDLTRSSDQLTYGIDQLLPS